jgi:hypothetical protein
MSFDPMTRRPPLKWHVTQPLQSRQDWFLIMRPILNSWWTFWLFPCVFLIHGHATVPDAAMYLNDMLKYQSVNLEDPQDLNLHQF